MPAIRNLYPPEGNNLAGLKVYQAYLTGAVGAACTLTKAKGFTTSTRTSAGLYTVKLVGNPGGDLCGLEASLAGPVSALSIRILSYVRATGVVTFSTFTAVAGVATDITVTEFVTLKLSFCKSVG